MTAEGGRGRLVLVGTPIGNLEDLAPRASRILAEADLVFAEDTRRTARLAPPGRRMFSYYDSNAASRQPMLARALEDGLMVALVTDAGMPGISDPCYRAVRTAIEKGAAVEIVPGPCAAISALVASGLPTDRFSFEGFLPRKKGPASRRLAELAEDSRTLVFYIPPHDLVDALEMMHSILGDREAVVAREMTKVHEEFARGTLSALLAEFASRTPRGEITLVVAGFRP